MSAFTSDCESTPERRFVSNNTLPFSVKDVKKAAGDAAGARVDRWTSFTRPACAVKELKLKRWINNKLFERGLDSYTKIWVSLSDTNYCVCLGEYEPGSKCMLVFDWRTAELLGVLPSQKLRVGVCWIRNCDGASIAGSSFLVCWYHRRDSVVKTWNTNAQSELMECDDADPIYNRSVMIKREERHTVSARKMREQYFYMINELLQAINIGGSCKFPVVEPVEESLVNGLKRAILGKVIRHKTFHLTFDEFNDAFLIKDSAVDANWTQICSDTVTCGKIVQCNLSYCMDHEPAIDWKQLARNAIMNIGEIKDWSELNEDVMERVINSIRRQPNAELHFSSKGIIVVDEQLDIYVRVRNARWHTFKLCPNYDTGCDEFRTRFAVCTQCHNGFVFDVLFGYDVISEAYVSVVKKRKITEKSGKIKWEQQIMQSLRYRNTLKLQKIKIVADIKKRVDAYSVHSSLIIYALFQADALGIKINFLNKMPFTTRSTFKFVMKMVEEENGSLVNMPGPCKSTDSDLLQKFRTPLADDDLRATVYLIEYCGNCYVGLLTFKEGQKREGLVVARCHSNQNKDSTGAWHVYLLARPSKPNESTIGIKPKLSKMSDEAAETLFILSYMYAEQVLCDERVKQLFNQKLSSVDLPLGWSRSFWQIVRERFDDTRQFVWSAAPPRFSLLNAFRHRLSSSDYKSRVNEWVNRESESNDDDEADESLSEM